MSGQGLFVGNSADIRTILNFKVSPTAIQGVLPQGWEQSPEMSGPAAGANLRVTFVIPLSGNDSSGKPVPNIRYVIFSVPVRRSGNSDTNQLMLIMGLTNGGKGPYETNVNAKDTIEHKAHYEGATMLLDESWSFVGDDGSTVSLQMRYSRGLLVRNKAEARVFSKVKPDFSRIYRYQQGVDVVRGENVPHERLQTFSFRTGGRPFSRFFDGTEELISVIALPWYNREIYLPDN